MKIILVFTLVLAKTLTEQIAELPQNQSSSTKIDTSNLRGGAGASAKKCTSNQTSIATQAVKSCDQIDFYTAASCIKKYILKNLNQRWNIFVRLNQNTDLPSYMAYDNCEVILRNEGKFHKTFIMWPAISYPSSNTANNALGKAEAPPTNPAEILIQGQCPDAKIYAVKASFNSCDEKITNGDAAKCIKEKMFTDLGENWNAWVSEKGSFTSFWFYDDCALFMPFQGTSKRSFCAWKASGP